MAAIVIKTDNYGDLVSGFSLDKPTERRVHMTGHEGMQTFVAGYGYTSWPVRVPKFRAFSFSA